MPWNPRKPSKNKRVKLVKEWYVAVEKVTVQCVSCGFLKNYKKDEIPTYCPACEYKVKYDSGELLKCSTL